jgi:hypothetical protein
MAADELQFPRIQDGSQKRFLAPTVPANGKETECNLSFRSRAVRPLAEAAALRNDVRTLLVRLVVRLYIERQNVKKLAA